MSRRKVTIVGAGQVGATSAQLLAQKGYADIVLVDVAEGTAQGKALDLLEAGPVFGVDGQVVGTADYDATGGSDIAIITSGVARKPGMSRDDLVLTNKAIVEEVTRNLVAHSPDCILIVVTNPLDAMCQLAHHVSGFPRRRVIGQSGVLDTARFRTFVAQELKVSVEDVAAYVLGGHGDAMVPLTRLATVGGIPLSEMLPAERIEDIEARTRAGGGEIVELLKTGSAFQAPAAAVVQMVDAIVLDKKRILPCAVYLQGEYGIRDLFVGVPAKLGAEGMEQVIEIRLTPEEHAALQASAAGVRELVDVLGLK